MMIGDTPSSLTAALSLRVYPAIKKPVKTPHFIPDEIGPPGPWPMTPTVKTPITTTAVPITIGTVHGSPSSTIAPITDNVGPVPRERVDDREVRLAIAALQGERIAEVKHPTRNNGRHSQGRPCAGRRQHRPDGNRQINQGRSGR